MEHEIISRAEAKAKGLKFYFTGKPCKHGSVAERRTLDSKCSCDDCLDEKRQRDREYTQKNAEYNRAKAKLHYEQNREAGKIQRRLNYLNNREHYRELGREWSAKNAESVRARSREWLDNNRDRGNKSRGMWKKNNANKVLAWTAKRRAAKRERIPAWFGELDKFVLEEAYDLADKRKELTGIDWHIDHMIPMRSRKASGLHCADNIQVIPAALNLSKGNKMILTEPLAWLR